MAEQSPVDLEIGLHRWNLDSYAIELRCSLPGPDGEVEIRNSNGLRFDFNRLRSLGEDPTAYGKALSEFLFAEESLGSAFRVASGRAEEIGSDLRLRLFVGPTAPELHGIRWETLTDPRTETDATLVTSERLLFSRYLSSLGYLSGRMGGRIRLRPRAEDLRALVVIANPTGLEAYSPGGVQLQAIDVAAELALARKGLEGLKVDEIASGGGATLDALVDGLRNGVDILYLVAHGALVETGPQLWLEQADGSVAVASGDDLVSRLRDLRQLPRLVILASCRSGGSGEPASSDGDGDFLRALGPALADTGVPAVIAMQGNIAIKTVDTFMSKLFVELGRDGLIDRAMAAARGSIREEPDSWMPMLFMRLRTGRLWYAPGFADPRGFQRWPALRDAILKKQCTPILGPGTFESLFGTRREVARRWAEEFGFPMAPQESVDLPQVAQYLAVQQSPAYPPSALKSYLAKEMLSRYAAELPSELREAKEPDLLALLSAVGAQRRKTDPEDIYAVLARLPFPIYVTTSPGSMLSDALGEEGRAPVTEICRWTDDELWQPSIAASEPGYRPDEKRPLVYHVFGHFAQEDSLVLTEDNHFDYLINTTRNGITRSTDLIPSLVSSMLSRTALLFLGFQMDDWTFRVLFRTIMSQEGRELRSRFRHVAVQVSPEDDRILNPDRARDYFMEYFRGADVDVFWGSVEDFVAELSRQIPRSA